METDEEAPLALTGKVLPPSEDDMENLVPDVIHRPSETLRSIMSSRKLHPEMVRIEVMAEIRSSITPLKHRRQESQLRRAVAWLGWRRALGLMCG